MHDGALEYQTTSVAALFWLNLLGGWAYSYIKCNGFGVLGAVYFMFSLFFFLFMIWLSEIL